MQVSYGNVSLIYLILSTIDHSYCFSYEAIFSSLIERKYIFDDDSCGEETDDRRVRNKPS